jgi:hypothetical protein
MSSGREASANLLNVMLNTAERGWHAALTDHCDTESAGVDP